MPTYEYECAKCKRRFEVFQSMKDAPLTACERCGGPVKRLISGGAGLLFKGSGFHLTDYRSESYRKRAREESGSAPKSKGVPAGDKKDPPASGDKKRAERGHAGKKKESE